MPKHRDYYEVLHVSRNASTQEVKQAFRQLARRYHPDLHPEDHTAVDKFREIREAYEVLSDEVRRRRYDQQLAKQTPAGQATTGQTKTSQGLNSQVFYARGVEKTLKRNYIEAIEDFTKALELDPRFLEAYLKRSEVYFYLRRDRELLDDCVKILQIKPDSAHAYYYRGRARHRLGYIESAVEAYTQAIRLEPDRAQAYYYRGLANYELSERSQAVRDWREYAEICREQGDLQGYRLAHNSINRLVWMPLRWGRRSLEATVVGVRGGVEDFCKAIQRLMTNPVGGILPTYASLSPSRAGTIGVGFAALANLCFVYSTYFGWQLGNLISISELIIIGIVPFLSLFFTSAMARSLVRRPGKLVGDLFVAGSTLLPLGFLALIGGFSTSIPLLLTIVLTVFATCYTVFILYGGCTQISNLSERAAAFAVPTMLLVSGWMFYVTFTVFRLQQF